MNFRSLETSANLHRSLAGAGMTFPLFLKFIQLEKVVTFLGKLIEIVIECSYL